MTSGVSEFLALARKRGATIELVDGEIDIVADDITVAQDLADKAREILDELMGTLAVLETFPDESPRQPHRTELLFVVRVGDEGSFTRLGDGYSGNLRERLDPAIESNPASMATFSGQPCPWCSKAGALSCPDCGLIAVRACVRCGGRLPAFYCRECQAFVKDDTWYCPESGKHKPKATGEPRNAFAILHCPVCMLPTDGPIVGVKVGPSNSYRKSNDDEIDEAEAMRVRYSCDACGIIFGCEVGHCDECDYHFEIGSEHSCQRMRDLAAGPLIGLTSARSADNGTGVVGFHNESPVAEDHTEEPAPPPVADKNKLPANLADWPFEKLVAFLASGCRRVVVGEG